MALPTNSEATVTLSTEDLKFLEDSLQRDAVGLLRSGCDTEHPTYRQNREIFGRVWDALYATTEGL